MADRTANSLVLAVIPGYTNGMKTAISLPDDVFAKAEHLARTKGMSRSELYATALKDYIQRQDRANLTEEINRAIDEIGLDAFRVDPALAAHQAKLLPREEW